MALQLDHTIVPAYDKVKSAKFIARMFGLEYKGTWGHFAPVKVNDTLTLDFDDSDDPRSNHYAFLASDEEFRCGAPARQGRGHPLRERPPLSDGWRDQPQAPGTRVLLRLRERARVGGHHPHIYHRMTIAVTKSYRLLC